MNLLGRKKDNAQTEAAAGETAEATTASADAAPAEGRKRRGTAPKGRPTPKRSEAERRRRGPVAPAPMTAAEARRRRKELRKTMTKEERKAEKLRRRAELAEQRERMMAGEEAYLLPRDKGPVRRYVRDIVDARRNVLGLFMPAALALIFIMLSVPSVAVQQAVSPAMLALMLVMLIDAFVLGRKVNRMVARKFPNTDETGWRLGLYAASRASQLRRMRAPRPQVERGAKID
ncbi:DUF3043 domain-containing protein [uncultured Mycolicibacterium sp.]|uniref:DUF3043 domain-containing protein n=1 Tax=uncultured Mycolicibacterium sp. TaxID=2320817 RepID=UPI002603009F|nr:DUF3043 domain-containing protein [uncultured Mycolicibacterium sp.]